MQPFPTTIDITGLAKSLALNQLQQHREIDDNDELTNAMLDELINEILSTLTPIEE